MWTEFISIYLLLIIYLLLSKNGTGTMHTFPKQLIDKLISQRHTILRQKTPEKATNLLTRVHSKIRAYELIKNSQLDEVLDKWLN